LTIPLRKLLPDYSNEKWVELFQLALLELRPELLEARIAAARSEIDRRAEFLEGGPIKFAEERRAMTDALCGLRTLENIETRRHV
jgi:hypothetical protein